MFLRADGAQVTVEQGRPLHIPERTALGLSEGASIEDRDVPLRPARRGPGIAYRQAPCTNRNGVRCDEDPQRIRPRQMFAKLAGHGGGKLPDELWNAREGYRRGVVGTSLESDIEGRMERDELR